MNGDCENCAFWRDHYYWEHMGDEKKQFSAVAKGDFKNSICIPRELSTHLRSRIYDTIKLDAPNGRTYDVVVTWEFGELVLRSGWDAFVTAHHIEENDTFLFIYRGNSNFRFIYLIHAVVRRWLPAFNHLQRSLEPFLPVSLVIIMC